jgi:rRNA maturation protein Nop10
MNSDRCPSCGRALDRQTGNCRDQNDCGWCAPPRFAPVDQLEGARWAKQVRRQLREQLSQDDGPEAA